MTGFFNQTAALNLKHDDTGGELDPHGADMLGNPVGGTYARCFEDRTYLLTT